MMDYLKHSCKHCEELTLIYNQQIADEFCESCGEWQSEEEETE